MTAAIRHYFAYSTFIHPQETARSLPGAKVLATGRAANTRFMFSHSPHSPLVGQCHLSDREDAFGYETWGLVCELPDEMLHRLAYNGYEKTSLTVHGSDGKPYDCFTIRLVQPGHALRVADWKFALIEEGARHHRFPASYLDYLRKTFEQAAPLERQPPRP